MAMKSSWEFWRKVKRLIGIPAGADVSTDIAAVKTDTTAILADTVTLDTERAQREVSKMAVDDNATDSFEDIVNITDKGVLTGISQIITTFTAASNVQLNIVIDGVTVFDSLTINNFVTIGDTISFAFNHRFDTSLLVQHKVSSNSKGTVRSFVMYTTD